MSQHEGIDTDTVVKLVVHDPDEYGQVGPEEFRDWVRERLRARAERLRR